MAKSKIGYMKCETRKCLNGDGGGGRVVVFINEHKTLSYRCDECGSSPYVKEGSGQYAAWIRDMEKAPGAPAPAAAPPAPPAPPAKKKTPGSLLEAAEG
jgi:hypothetical protein